MIIAIVSALLGFGLGWLFLKTSRDRCHRCGRVDWLMRMRAYELWVGKEEKPRIIYNHTKVCGRGPIWPVNVDTYKDRGGPWNV